MSGKAGKKKMPGTKPGEENEDVAAQQQEEDKQTEESEQVDEIEELRGSVEQLKGEVEDYKNQYLRKHADYENFRKRLLREKDESIKYANEALLKDLMTVIDDFERAIQSAEETKDFESFLSGIKLIEKRFVSMLEQNWGLKRMETAGEEFDPQRHEALMMEERPDCDREEVVEVYQKGYSLNDRVIRHAKVKVGKPTSEAAAEKDTETGDGQSAAEDQKQ
ncbi:MAG: nucleotide exchange factor GrpE [Spirochaetota bacterium]